MLDVGFNLGAEATALVQMAATIIVAVVVLTTFLKTRALIPVLGVAVIGGFVVWVVFGGARWIGNRIDDDADRLTAPAVHTITPDIDEVARPRTMT